MAEPGVKRTRRRSVAFFAMPEAGHFRVLVPLIRGLAERGMAAYVFTDRRFQPAVEEAGGVFVDLFSKYPIERVDDESIPVPCRFVTFAGVYAEQIIRDLEALRPDLVVYETFALIARLVARSLGVPHVHVCAGHDMDPDRILPALEVDPRVSISRECERAVEALGERYGLDGASPFSYVCGLSPFLNVYCEPPAFLTQDQRRTFEPISFFGSLPPLSQIDARRRNGGASRFGGDGTELKVYTSFGTVVWRYWAAEAMEALGAISDSLAKMPGVRAILDAKAAKVVTDAARTLEKPNVAVRSDVDQWALLQETDLFVTHHGLSSTHEAIFHGVPMVSYPFFSDQPALAKKCQGFGIAIPLTDSPRGRITEAHVSAAVAELEGRRASIHASLARARDWELRVLAGRDSVLGQITDLIGA